MKRPPACRKCGALLGAPRELEEGLPGIRYHVCEGCGWTRATTRRAPRERLPETPVQPEPKP